LYHPSKLKRTILIAYTAATLVAIVIKPLVKLKLAAVVSTAD